MLKTGGDFNLASFIMTVLITNPSIFQLMLYRCLRVPLGEGETVRRELLRQGQLNTDVHPLAKGDWLYLPLKTGDMEDLLKAEFTVEDVELRQVNRGRTAEDILGFKPSYEVIGDIAIAAPGSAENVGEALLAVHPHIKTVLMPIGTVEGEFRTKKFSLLTGEDKRVTLHRENGLQLRVDLESAYFSPRLATERIRIARQVKPDEVIVDMFAGVGPIALLLATKAKRVYAADLNPLAVKLLRENVALNRLGNVMPMLSDAAALELPEKCDRVVMNLPHGAAGFLQKAVELLENRGVIHFYTIGPEDSPYRESESAVGEIAQNSGVEIEIKGRRVVHSYAPRVELVVLDLSVSTS
jgi:tRNA (guanine37-N1)-methyltransferase